LIMWSCFLDLRLRLRLRLIYLYTASLYINKNISKAVNKYTIQLLFVNEDKN
jgi:hypothetical protein